MGNWYTEEVPLPNSFERFTSTRWIRMSKGFVVSVREHSEEGVFMVYAGMKDKSRTHRCTEQLLITALAKADQILKEPPRNKRKRRVIRKQKPEV